MLKRPWSSEAVEVEKEVTRIVEKQVAAPKEPITLIIQHVHPAYEAFGAESCDPAFQEKYPDVTIKRELTPGWLGPYYPKLMTMHAAGTPWDVAQLPAYSGTEYSLFLKGVLKGLDPLIEKDQYDYSRFLSACVTG